MQRGQPVCVELYLFLVENDQLGLVAAKSALERGRKSPDSVGQHPLLQNKLRDIELLFSVTFGSLDHPIEATSEHEAA